MCRPQGKEDFGWHTYVGETRIRPCMDDCPFGTDTQLTPSEYLVYNGTFVVHTSANMTYWTYWAPNPYYLEGGVWYTEWLAIEDETVNNIEVLVNRGEAANDPAYADELQLGFLISYNDVNCSNNQVCPSGCTNHGD